MSYPKRITPNTLTRRSLHFDKKDISILVEHLRGQFHKIFTGWGRLDFAYMGDRLTFFPTRTITSVSAQRHLNGLGINPHLIEMAVKAIESLEGERFPTPDQIRYGQWFGSILAGYLGKEIKAVLSATPESRAKWDQRLKQCGRTWKDFVLSDDAIAKVTEELFRAVLKQTVLAETVEKRLIRWKRVHLDAWKAVGQAYQDP